MTCLDDAIGGFDQQKRLIQKKIDRELSKLSPFQTEWMSYTLFSVYGKLSKLLRGPGNEEEMKEKSKQLRSVFWEKFEKYEDGTLQKFVNAFPFKVSCPIPFTSCLTVNSRKLSSIQCKSFSSSAS